MFSLWNGFSGSNEKKLHLRTKNKKEKGGGKKHAEMIEKSTLRVEIWVSIRIYTN